MGNGQKPEILSLAATDGQSLSANFYNSGKSTICCIIAPGIAITRNFYDAFARYLQTKGISVITFDVRGFGSSPLKPGGFADGWQAFGRDVDAMIEAASKRGSELVYVGHSLGTQILGFASRNREIKRAVSIASGTGYYRWSEGFERSKRWFLWTALLPVLSRSLGHFPGQSLGVLGTLPKPIALTWARMCLTPGYIKPGHDDPPPASFLAFQGDMMVLSFTDDTIMPKAAVDALHRNFLSASVTARHVSPAEMDMTSTGHFGAFRPGSPKLWGMIADWLAGQRAR